MPDNNIPPSTYTTITTKTFSKAPEGTVISKNTQPALLANKRPRRRMRWVLFIFLLFVFGLVGFILVRADSLSSHIFVGEKMNFAQKIHNFFQASSGSLKLEGEDTGQVNILLLGIGGEGHDGPYLTDTIILAQLRPQINSATLVSIPRDYMLDMKGLQGRKINAAFAEGMARSNKDWAVGGQWARDAVSSISGLDIPYFAVIDFKGFEKAIDEVGGLDITIDRTFTDYTYPDENNGYLPAVTFKQGQEHMSGSRALIFSRSRHAAGLEGSDFARSERQQKVIHAFKEKVVSLNLISDVGSINKLAGIFADHFHTNLTPGELYRLFDLGKTFSRDQIMFLPLDPVNKLICSQILEDSGAYVLVPCYGKNEADVQRFFKNSFSIARLGSEKATVWLADTTNTPRNYKYAEKTLTSAGITTYQTNFTDPTLSRTVVYSVNSKPATLEFIKNNLGAEEITLPPPDFKINPDKVDLIVILGGKPNFPSGEENKPSVYNKYRFRTATSTKASPETENNTSTPSSSSGSGPVIFGTSTGASSKATTTSSSTKASSTPTSTKPKATSIPTTTKKATSTSTTTKTP